MAWLAGYTYRKKKPVNATEAGAQTLYQLKLLVGESSGAGGADIHCEDHCQDFPNDIRFTGADETSKHDYWVESLTGVTPNRLATIWIEVATIPAAGSVDLYMYYNKTSDSGESKGDDTFLFFDDFSVWGTIEVGSTGVEWTYVRNIDIKGDYAYVTTNGYFRVIDISDPTNPNQVASIAISGNNLECIVSGDYVYITNINDQIHIINISNPTSPSLQGSLIDVTKLATAHGGWIDGNYFYVCAYTGARLTIVNVSDKSNPSVEGSVYDAVELNGAHDVIIEGNYAYVAVHWGTDQNEGSFTIVDISNKSNPTIVSSIQHADLRGGAGIQKKGNYVYVGATPNAGTYSGERLLITIDVSDVNNPSVGTIISDLFLYRCRIDGDYLYVASSTDIDFAKFDISNPAVPSKVSEKHYGGNSNFDLAISGDYLYGTKRNETSFVVMRKTLVAPETDKWNIPGQIGTWTIENNTLKALGSGTVLLKSKYTVPSEYVMNVKVKKGDDINIYGYPRYINNDNFVTGVLTGVTHAYRQFLVKENGSYTTSQKDTKNWEWNIWYNWQLSDGPAGTYEYITEKLDGSDSHTINIVDSVGFSGNLALAIYNGTGYFDDVFVRKYCDPAPTWGTSGDEQQESVTIPVSSNTSAAGMLM